MVENHYTNPWPFQEADSVVGRALASLDLCNYEAQYLVFYVAKFQVVCSGADSHLTTLVAVVGTSKVQSYAAQS